MTAFRPLDPFQVYTDLDGNLAAGGTLHFYEAGTTTDADVFGDEGLTTNNGPTIDIGTDGRAVDDIWADGANSYRCRVYDSNGTLIRDRDNIGLPGSGGLTIPSLTSGDFLTNDGSSLIWAAIRQALDPSGQSNKVVGSDGTNMVWVAKPSDGAAGTNADISVTSSSFEASPGIGSHWLVQMGSGSAPASGTASTGVTVEFDTEFSTTPKVFITPTTNATSGGYLGIPETNSVVTTGFSVQFSTNSTDSESTFINPLTFNWVAFGTLA